MAAVVVVVVEVVVAGAEVRSVKLFSIYPPRTRKKKKKYELQGSMACRWNSVTAATSVDDTGGGGGGGGGGCDIDGRRGFCRNRDGGELWSCGVGDDMVAVAMLVKARNLTGVGVIVEEVRGEKMVVVVVVVVVSALPAVLMRLSFRLMTL
ncbi:hypothetical protein E2C01_063081 [Portunus trituberculatus]|uniref:Uncharacterized protein n=1 Tax=Portunus trituberculatus TaxID=210409 RepID=A0A5B7H892_PORTR|nr:hypothetical protein [Portunus trituberculatus]